MCHPLHQSKTRQKKEIRERLKANRRAETSSREGRARDEKQASDGSGRLGTRQWLSIQDDLLRVFGEFEEIKETAQTSRERETSTREKKEMQKQAEDTFRSRMSDGWM